MTLVELEREYLALRQQSEAVRSYLDIPSKNKQLAVIEETIADPGFWNNQEASQKVMQERKRLEAFVHQDRSVTTLVSDIDTLFELGREGEDVGAELAREFDKLRKLVDHLETNMLLSGENDHCGAIVTIHPGAGGTESQDWAEMLLRMYLRWAERNGFSAAVTDRLEGEGAGIKSATVEIDGDNCFGLLQSEIGVHRLVRISPFDANARRHTSFASVFVIPLIDDDVKIDIKTEDIRIDVFRASGAGGQHVNRTESAVRFTHIPTGIVVQCQNERSQHKNRAAALKQLRARLYEYEMDKRRAAEKKLEDSKADANFGSQIRSYVLAPYRMVKDLRSRYSVGDVDRLLDGDMEDMIHAYLVWKKTGKTFGDSSKDDLAD
ncbi:peptide chain release factor 2 [Paludibaculum fermentans]|uniref:peptide chain release factor 2 n=1 Tax=Paludibaculum fermentans TaxID=1473598 RepID=UPI001E53CCBD|nr:peptide chain release factor 2 [Paludibaculum fermentans]